MRRVLKKYWHVPGLLILLVILFLLGSWYGKRQVARQKATGSRPILYYVDPMNPAHTSPKPGLAPCGMNLEPVYADAGGRAAGSTMPPGSFKITPEKQQIMGLRIAAVEQSPWTYTLRTSGKVAVDENRVYRLNAFIEGWVVKIFNNTTGSLVRKDDPLATFYNRDLPTLLQTYFFALDALDQEQKLFPGQQNLLIAQKLSAEGVLMNLGMGKSQLDALARSRQLTQEIVINAPATSFIRARNITPGQRFAAGEELYRLADLSRIWVLADLVESDAKYIRPGEKARVTLPSQGEKRMAAVSEILPVFDPATLTLKVRLEMDNPQFTLRPGMFVDVEFDIHMPPSVNVPAAAIIDSGRKHMVFVDRGNGYFEPRRVKTGWRLGDRVEIVEGLKAGEGIVASGNFLIDSETRLQLALAGMCREVTKDPVCGLKVNESGAKAAGFLSAHKNQTYFFCSDKCQRKFDQEPERYVAKPAASPAGKQEGIPPTHDAAAIARDPACGLTVVKETALQAGRTSEYQGKTYYFDTDGCKRRFDNNPQRYLTEGSGDKATSLINLQSYPTLPMDPATQEQDWRKLLWKRPNRPSGAMPHGPAGPKGLPGGLPRGTVLTGPHGATPAAPPGATLVPPQGPTSVQSQPQQTPPELPPKN
jgi:membrane fusion protein, copper/silver efflux system